MEKKSIKDIERLLVGIKSENDPFLLSIREDQRKGVQTLLKRWEKKRLETQQLLEQFEEMKKYERPLWDKGCRYIAGIDEVGRGPLAGPVVAAAVILPEDFHLPGLTDSKKLSAQKREHFFRYVKEHAISYGIGIIDSREIDQVNIYEATKLAMVQAVKDLHHTPEHLLIDAMKLDLDIEQTSIIKGDATSISIAAASVLAKETRDTYMKNLAKEFPDYGFDKNMGYGTPEHLLALQETGVTREHRQSFSPVKEMVD
ncbi:ribonuclease HII [Sutcliffiella horikoshii]|uniref:Ribonuclease HII n=1 Tax=Sutcliffiella horikoshii TaxID=79883 RepID=A0A5D4TBT9_9BACI|nr:ribonuclease HII [Sutcliffiella horikoshii]TYS72829.1 ribonuclease HII [Sutcliffiella horikoshii]